MNKKAEVKQGRIKLGVFGILERGGKVLMGLREPNDSSFPNCWCHPGGGVEFSEPVDVALKREFLEEVSLGVEVSKHYIGLHEYFENGRHVVLVFREVHSDSSPIAGDGFVRLGWFSLDDIRAMCQDGETTPLTIVAAEAWERFKAAL